MSKLLEALDAQSGSPEGIVDGHRRRFRDKVANVVDWGAELAGDTLRLGLRTTGNLTGSAIRGIGEGVWHGAKSTLRKGIGGK